MKILREREIRAAEPYERIVVVSRNGILPLAELEMLGVKEPEKAAEMLAQEKEGLLCPARNGYAHISLLKLCGDGRDIPERFAELGRRVKQDFRIVQAARALTDKETVCATASLITGAYTFNKEMLKSGYSDLFGSRDRFQCANNAYTVTVCGADPDAVDTGRRYGEAVNHARTLGNLPNNYLHRQELADYAQTLAEKCGLICRIFGNRELEEMGCGGILCVNQGSSREAGLITLERRTGTGPLTALIGKGVMFDAGGYHLKDRAGMEGMKYDMCGAAGVLAAMEILSEGGKAGNVLAVIPVVENVISPDAVKMDDVILTMSGRSVEVKNTDAEGRLILCDAITYAKSKGADRIIDLATLTYSCRQTLGTEISGIFSNDDDFCRRFTEAACESGEKVWRLPLDDCYRNMIQSNAADLKNYGSGEAGASVAACFLEEFTEGTPWIHLDIVGTASRKDATDCFDAGATGTLIRSVAAFLERNEE